MAHRSFASPALTLSAALGVALGVAAGTGAEAQTEVTPRVFDAPLDLSRGVLEPGWSNSHTLSFDDACLVVRQDWGWDSCGEIASFVIYHVPGVEMTVVKVPNDDGIVDIRDWNSDARAATVAAIERDLREGAASATDQLGVPVSFDGWVVEPTLNAADGYLYYATRLIWDGEPTINIDATVFDNQGFVPFQIIPAARTVTTDEVETLIDATLARYVPNAEVAYTPPDMGALDTGRAQGAVTVLSRLAGLQVTSTQDQASPGSDLLTRYWYVGAGFLVLLALFVMFGGRRDSGETPEA